MDDYLSNIYYDITINNLASNDSTPVIINYLDSRSLPIIKDTTGYALSIIRFTLDTQALPVFIPTIQTNQSDPNLTIYSITFDYTYNNVTYTFQQYIEFIPQDESTTTPIPPSQNPPYFTQVNSSGYYFVYNYSYFIYLINKALQNGINSLNDICVGAGVPFPTTVPPVMTFDLSTLVATINFNSTYYGTNEANKINIYFNQAMANLFCSFPYIILGSIVNYGENVQLALNYLANADGSPRNFVTQEYSTVSSWNPITSIVFTSGSLGIVSSQIALPYVYIDGKVINNNTTAGSFNVITDLVASDFQYKPDLIYNPTAQYRYISLLPNRSIRHVDLQIYFQLKDGSYVPLRLPTGSTCTMKLLFTRNFQNK